MYFFRSLGVVRAEPGIVGGYAGHDLNPYLSFAKHKLLLGQYMPHAVNHHRNDIYLQLLGEVECPAIKAEDRAIGRSCAFVKSLSVAITVPLLLGVTTT